MPCRPERGSRLLVGPPPGPAVAVADTSKTPHHGRPPTNRNRPTRMFHTQHQLDTHPKKSFSLPTPFTKKKKKKKKRIPLFSVWFSYDYLIFSFSFFWLAFQTHSDEVPGPHGGALYFFLMFLFPPIYFPFKKKKRNLPNRIEMFRDRIAPSCV